MVILVGNYAGVWLMMEQIGINPLYSELLIDLVGEHHWLVRPTDPRRRGQGHS